MSRRRSFWLVALTFSVAYVAFVAVKPSGISTEQALRGVVAKAGFGIRPSAEDQRELDKLFLEIQREEAWIEELKERMHEDEQHNR